MFRFLTICYILLAHVALGQLLGTCLVIAKENGLKATDTQGMVVLIAFIVYYHFAFGFFKIQKYLSNHETNKPQENH